MQALARAQQFNIDGVTWSLTQGVVKNIIPAIASTNAIIAGESHPQPLCALTQLRSSSLVAACCNEAFKIATCSAPYLDSYVMVRYGRGCLPRT